jgi:hypothetical protein
MNGTFVVLHEVTIVSFSKFSNKACVGFFNFQSILFVLIRETKITKTFSNTKILITHEHRPNSNKFLKGIVDWVLIFRHLVGAVGVSKLIRLVVDHWRAINWTQTDSEMVKNEENV